MAVRRNSSRFTSYLLMLNLAKEEILILHIHHQLWGAQNIAKKCHTPQIAHVIPLSLHNLQAQKPVVRQRKWRNAVPWMSKAYSYCLLSSAMSEVLLACIRRKQANTEQSKAWQSLYTFTRERLVIHTYLNTRRNPQTNKTSVYHQPQHLWRNHDAAVYQAVLLKSQFFCWGEFNNKQVEWFGLSSKLYHHAKGKVKLQKSFCVAILFPVSLFFDMKSMKTKLFTHFWSDQSHIAG